MNKPERKIESRESHQIPEAADSTSSSTRRKLRRLTRDVGVMGIDFTVVFVTLFAALNLFPIEPFGPVLGFVPFTLAFAVVAVAVFALSGLYKRSWRFVNFTHSSFLGMVILGGLALAWVLAAAIPAVREQAGLLIPVAVIQWAFATLGMLSARMMRRVERQFFERRRLVVRPKPLSAERKKAVLIGSWQWARISIDIANTDQSSSMEIQGVLLPRQEDALLRVDDIPVLGSQYDLPAVLRQLEFEDNSPDYVVVCDDGTFLSNRDVTRIIHTCRERKVEVRRVRDPWAQLLQQASPANAPRLPIEDLLGRSEYKRDNKSVLRQIAGRSILVTGAGGTIGSELCRQIAQIKPSRLVLLDSSEYNLYQIDMSLRELFPDLEIVSEIASICDAAAINRVFENNRPSIVFHAAALKHVPIVEANPCAGAMTNIIGTRIISNAVCLFGAKAMIQVSTDKAVNPIGVMGATKRVGELYCQALDMCGVDDPDAPRFMTVRFGNVLGSSGSIVPLFERQLREGKPLTVTHPDIERFFMTVREAVQLILQSSSSALEYETQRGSIFVLDMGNPVRIVDLARRMITLYGLEPEEDVPIEFVGLRPGEKLYEELFDICEEQVESGIEGIFEARSRPIPLPFITMAINLIAERADAGEDEGIIRLVHGLARYPANGNDHDLLQYSSAAELTTLFERAYRAETANDR
ncbi:polysaccharide biosynthesis protein [Aurantiacibacter rhizosphaerae]|uniref:NAD-dependent epimerase/dehydratase family protein n=1 Tax=Aurantiacibacter rhizosphaerae TaxID=2691582 RepID=A0A844XCU3_9SPHN|nr:polysaccharide biosynthesis protein [Aurantiacibacter rhizosphaerae]MWV27583.1 NAD-dependent epimerase/dehydratase family protein [Aurantiacibacter rhizosphaerae]